MRFFSTILIIVVSSFLAIGQQINNFSLTDVTSGNLMELNDYMGDIATVVIFFNTSCAYDNHYVERIRNLHHEFATNGFTFVLVNSSSSGYQEKDPEDAMKAFLTNNKLEMPFLLDENKKVQHKFKASRTPEVFILQSNQSSFNIVYHGSIDNNPLAANDVDHEYLKEALVALQQNKQIKMNTKLFGCLIK